MDSSVNTDGSDEVSVLGPKLLSSSFCTLTDRGTDRNRVSGVGVWSPLDPGPYVPLILDVTGFLQCHVSWVPIFVHTWKTTLRVHRPTPRCVNL